MHARRSSKPFGVHLPDEWVPNTLQRLNEFVFKARLGFEGVAGVEHRVKILENIAILSPGDVRESLHRYVVLCALEPTDDVLSHLGLILTIAERTSVFDELNSNRRKRASSTSPKRTPARAPITSWLTNPHR